MKRSTKQLLSAVLVIAMMFSMLVVPAAAATTDAGTYEFSKADFTMPGPTSAEDTTIKDGENDKLPASDEKMTAVSTNGGYFLFTSGAVLRANTGEGAVKDTTCAGIELDKNGSAAMTFTVTGKADVTITLASTGSGKTSNFALTKGEEATAITPTSADTSNTTATTNEAMTTVTGTNKGVAFTWTGLTEGSYKLNCPSGGATGLRVYGAKAVQTAVTEEPTEEPSESESASASASETTSPEPTPSQGTDPKPPVAGDNEWVANLEDIKAANNNSLQVPASTPALKVPTSVSGVDFYIGGGEKTDGTPNTYKLTGDDPAGLTTSEANSLDDEGKGISETKPVPALGTYFKWVATADGVFEFTGYFNGDSKKVFVTQNGKALDDYNGAAKAKETFTVTISVKKDDVITYGMNGSKPMLASFKFTEVKVVGGEWIANLEDIKAANNNSLQVPASTPALKVPTSVSGVDFYIGGGEKTDGTPNTYKLTGDDPAGLTTSEANSLDDEGKGISETKPVPALGTYFKWVATADGVFEFTGYFNGDSKKVFVTQNGKALDDYNGAAKAKETFTVTISVKKDDVITYGMNGSKPMLASFKMTGGGSGPIEEKDVEWSESGVCQGATPTMTATDDGKGTITVTVNGPLAGKKTDVAAGAIWKGVDKVVVEAYDKAGNLVTYGTSTAAGTSHKVKIVPSASAPEGFTFKLKVQKGSEELTLTPTASVASFVLPLAKGEILFATSKGAGADGKGTVEVIWKPVDEATGYNVYRDGTKVNAEPVATTTYMDTGLTIGTEYSYTVEALRNSEVGAKSDAVKATATADAKTAWGFVCYGESVSTKNNYSEGNPNDNNLKVIAKGNGGKLQVGAYDGVSFYYTQIPSTKNFKLSALVTVDTWAYSNGQEGFGLMATDTLGEYDGAFGKTYHNNYMLGGMRTDKTDYDGYLGMGMIQETGYTNEQIATDYANGVVSTPKVGEIVNMDPFAESAGLTGLGKGYNLIGNYTALAEETKAVNIDTLGGQFSDLKLQTTFKLTIERNNTGYFFTYESVGDQNARQMTKTYKTYETYDDLCVQDPDNIYVGFFTARNVTISVKDVELTTINKADDDTPKEDPPTIWIDPTLSMNSSATTNSEDYTLTLTSNVVGTAHVSVNGVKVGDYPVTFQTTDENAAADAKGALKRADIPLTLTTGNNKIYVTFTPAADSEQGFANTWTKVSALSVKPIDRTVTYETKFDKMNNLYVANNGSKRGNGTKEHPLDIYTAVTVAQPGQKVILMEGVYKLGRTGTITIPDNVCGTSDAPIYLIGDPEAETRPVFDFEGLCQGISFAGSYWYCQGFDITHSQDGKNGMNVGGHNNVFDSVDAYLNGGSGIQISRISGINVLKDNWPSNNKFINCVSYLNADAQHEDADGFGSKLTVGEGNEFFGCVAAYNADDGWDCFAKAETGPIGVVKINNSYAFMNGYVAAKDADGNITGVVKGKGNGNGFKLGGSSIKGAHEVNDSYAFANCAKGVDSNSGPDVISTNTISYNNQGSNVGLYSSAANTAYKLSNIISVKDAGAGDKKSVADSVKGSGTQVTADINGEDVYLWDGSAAKNAKGTSLKSSDQLFVSTDMEAGVSFIDVTTQTVTRVGGGKTGPISIGDFLKLKDTAGVAGPGDLADAEITYPAPVDPDLDTITPDDPANIPAVTTSSVTVAGSSGRDDERGETSTTGEGENTVDKKTNSAGERVITVKDPTGEVLAEVTLPATTPTTDKTFVDVPEDHWAADAINEMAARGIVNGVGEDTFDMDSAVTRGTLATMLFRLSNGKEGYTNDFTDVADNSWYKDAVAWAAKAGVVTGFGDGTFGGDQTITREQLALMLYRYAGLLGMDTTKTTDLTTFTDAAAVDSWAADGMNWAVANGIINGMGENNLA
ncbi:MAG: S-layer homology domain-containing protein, partial [Roseburia sp.]|nr:S-layer homology domain-containing protein [Roseburia sp.]